MTTTHAQTAVCSDMYSTMSIKHQQRTAQNHSRPIRVHIHGAELKNTGILLSVSIQELSSRDSKILLQKCKE